MKGAEEKTKIEDKKRSYEFLMKYGLNRHYWNEYIIEAYINNRNDMIRLTGFPRYSVEHASFQ